MKPCLTRSSSWTMSGRSRLSAYENVVKWKPGRSSSVIAAPPTRWRRSRISVLQAGLGEVGAVDEAVVAAADDDRVVVLVCRCHGQAVFRGGLKNGRRVTSAATVS